MQGNGVSFLSHLLRGYVFADPLFHNFVGQTKVLVLESVYSMEFASAKQESICSLMNEIK